ncbi:MAG: carboxypeptidase M32 [Saprospiraceae bacterium]|nr:carboxypeptidase M32 [Saprospiraceae bacterium]
MKVSSYKKLKERMSRLADINGAIAALSWDKETYLPPKSDRFRSQQIATLSSISHEEFTSDETRDLLAKTATIKNLTAKEKKNLLVLQKEFDKSVRFSKEFVVKRSMIISQAFHHWVEAKEKNNFKLFAPALDQLINLKREEAAILGKNTHPYNNLLEEYEPGATVEKLDGLFEEVRSKLLPMISKIREAKPVKSSFLKKEYPQGKQWDFGLSLLNSIGYDFDRGRQDISHHPFTIGIAPDDVRITTRIDENDFSNMTFSCLHEAGHALYEQGLDINEYGLPCGGPASLAIHESQSRLWENHVGRSMNFWQAHYPGLQKEFKSLKKVGLKDFYYGINKVKPNLIRTEADELHYHIHVMIRYEIEKEMLMGNLDAAGAQEQWKSKYKDYLGLDIQDDSEGILQDVHWSHGSFGYFPTYSMGSFYAAQFFKQAQKDLTDLDEQIAKGNTAPLLQWLRENIHQHGRRYEAEELCKRVTGKPLNLKAFIDHAKEKYSDIYRINL